MRTRGGHADLEFDTPEALNLLLYLRDAIGASSRLAPWTSAERAGDARSSIATERPDLASAWESTWQSAMEQLATTPRIPSLADILLPTRRAFEERRRFVEVFSLDKIVDSSLAPVWGQVAPRATRWWGSVSGAKASLVSRISAELVDKVSSHIPPGWAEGPVRFLVVVSDDASFVSPFPKSFIIGSAVLDDPDLFVRALY